MKNLLDFLKIFIVCVIFSSVMIISANCSASPITYLKSVVGNWYNTNGNLALTISSDYKLNGCQIMNLNAGGDALVGTFEVTYRDGNQNKFIEFWELSSVSNDYKFLIMNPGSSNNYVLRKTKNPQYYESVGGIYLGMSESELLKLYGAPSSKEHYNRFLKNWIWKYNNLGLEISTYGGIVTEITFYSNGDRKFDRSGLSANNSMTDFENKYGKKFSRRNNLDIGHGELINFSNGIVSLIIHTFSYVV